MCVCGEAWGGGGGGEGRGAVQHREVLGWASTSNVSRNAPRWLPACPLPAPAGPCPQDFPRIATFLPGRTVEEVVRLYYALQVGVGKVCVWEGGACVWGGGGGWGNG